MGRSTRRVATWRRAAGTVVGGPVAAASGLVGGLTTYLGVLSVVGTVVQRRRTTASIAAAGDVRFAVMVPAHDEEAVIGDAVASMLAIDYPREQFAVHVVGDNCTDRTLDIVRDLGAHAHERVDPAHPGKGPALNWLHDRLVEQDPPFDWYVIVDADTTVDPQFLAEMERAIASGALAAQGFYDVRDPDRSPAAGLRAAALACRHHLRPLGRQAIGGSCGLFGNGMAFSASVLASRRWSGHLTEDLEFQLEMLLDGDRVAYVPGARIEAEMPHDLESSVSQHQRWERGRIQIASTYLPRLLRGLVAPRSTARVAHADAILDQLVPPVSVLAAGQIVVDVAALAVLALSPSRRHRRLLAVNAVSTAVLAGHVLAGLQSVHAPANVYRSLAGAPGLLVWKLRLWLGVLGGRSEVVWSRTARNADADADALTEVGR